MSRTQPEFRGSDGEGPFVWVYAIVVASRSVGTQLHHGMRDFPVNIALVIDNTAVRDDELDFGKLEYVAVGFVDDLGIEQG
jgi:hypothetical protein